MYYKYILTTLFFLYSFILALYSNIHTDEYWSYATIYYYSKGLIPYIDYFNHRLPIVDIFYGSVFKLLEISLVKARIISAILATFSLYLTLKLVKDKYDKIIIFLIYCQPLHVAMLSTVTTYALSGVLNSAAIIFLLRNYFKKYLFINVFFYLTRYLLDFSIIVSSAISLVVYKSRQKFIISITISLITIICLYILFGENVYWHTFNFNKNSFQYMQLNGVFDDYYSDKINKFLLLRKLELYGWYNIYFVFIVATYFIYKNKIYKESVFSIYAILLAIYSFYYITFNDYPITKIYAIPFIIALWAISGEYISKKIKFTVILTLTIGLINQNIKITTDQLTDICNKIDCSSKSFATNPILNTSINNSNRNFIMELYSLAHNDPIKYLLYNSELFTKEIVTGNYKYLILDQRFHSRENMSKMIGDYQYKEIINYLNSEYKIREIYFDKKLDQSVYIYKKND